MRMKYNNCMTVNNLLCPCCTLTMGWTVRVRIPVGQDFPPIQTGPGAHPASCTMGIGSFPGVKYSQGVLLITHPLLVL